MHTKERVQQARASRPQAIRGEVRCPAGRTTYELNGNNGCRCRIVHETIDSRSNPASLLKYCLADYMRCPIWRDYRDEEIAQRAKALQEHLDTEAREAGEPV